MSRQIQFRRGTTAQNDQFTGAIGEITVDTTLNTLRVHDGKTAGGHKIARMADVPDVYCSDGVVQFQMPSSENKYTWFRKYKSGWVEQGGIADSSETSERWTSVTVNFPIKMRDKFYTAIATPYGLDSVSTIICNIGGMTANGTDNNTGKTTTGMLIQMERLYTNGPTRVTRVQWRICGMGGE